MPFNSSPTFAFPALPIGRGAAHIWLWLMRPPTGAVDTVRDATHRRVSVPMHGHVAVQLDTVSSGGHIAAGAGPQSEARSKKEGDSNPGILG